MSNLADFYQGDTKRWRVVFPYNISSAIIKFRMIDKLETATPQVVITGVLDAPDGNGDIFGVTIEISPALSATLIPGEFLSEHEITNGGDVTTFLVQKIRVKAGIG